MIRIPLYDDTFICNLILQRTGPFLEIPGGAQAIEAWSRTGDRGHILSVLDTEVTIRSLMDRILRDAASDAKQVANLLRTRRRTIDSLCSIGPGNGVVELFLIRALGVKSVLLIDIESSTSHRHGYETRGSGYSSLVQTKAFIENNTPRPLTIELCNPRKQEMRPLNHELVLSLLSMGFHFPCDEYKDFIINNKVENGNLIIDKRFGVLDRGLGEIMASYTLDAIHNNGKFGRILLTKFTQRET